MEVSPSGNLGIVQRGKLSPRGAGDSRVTIQAALILGLKPRQVSLQPSEPTSTQDPKTRHPEQALLPKRKSGGHSLPIQLRTRGHATRAVHQAASSLQEHLLSIYYMSVPLSTCGKRRSQPGKDRLVITPQQPRPALGWDSRPQFEVTWVLGP